MDDSGTVVSTGGRLCQHRNGGEGQQYSALGAGGDAYVLQGYMMTSS